MRRSPRAPDAATGTASLPSAPAKRTHTYRRWPHHLRHKPPARRRRRRHNAAAPDTRRAQRRLPKLRQTPPQRLHPRDRRKRQSRRMPRTKLGTDDPADWGKSSPDGAQEAQPPPLTAPPKGQQAPTDAKGPPRHEKAPRPRKEPQNSRKQTVVGCKPMSGGELRARKIPINPVEFR
jgi:hypothetical protein